MTNIENTQIPTDDQELQVTPDKPKSATGWKVATAIFAAAAIGAGAWGLSVTATNSDLEAQVTTLEQQVASLEGTVDDQQAAGKALATLGKAEIATLQTELAALTAAYDDMQKQSEQVLAAVEKEYQAAEEALQTAEEAVTAVAAQQQVDQEAYQNAADAVVAAQQAVLDLLIEVINVVESAE